MQIIESNAKEILEKRRAGVSVNALRNEYGTSYTAMDRFLAEHNCSATLWKLSEEQQKLLVADRMANMSVTNLATKYKISPMSVYNYLRKNQVQRLPQKRLKNMNTDFFKTLTPESLWVLGWFFSDGNVSKISNKFSITVHKNDETLLKKIQTVMAFDRDSIFRPKTVKAMELYGCEPTIHADLIGLGCVPNKSLIIRYPTILTEDWQHWAFLRGVFEGDGHASFKAKGNRPGFSCEISSGSMEFLKDVAKILKDRLNIDTNIIQRPNTHSTRIYILGGREQVLKFLDCLYKDCPERLRLERKYQTYLKMHEVALRPNLPTFANRETMRSGYFLSPDNRVYFVKGLKKFAVEMNLSIGCLINLLKPVTRRSKSHRYGWTRPTQDQINTARTSGALIEKIY